MSRKTRPAFKDIIDNLDVREGLDIVRPTAVVAALSMPNSSLSPTPHSFKPWAAVKFDPRNDDPIYAGLSPASREQLFAIEERLERIEEISLLARGRELMAAKTLLVEEKGHGHWLEWLKHKGTPATTASALVRAAEWIEESAIVAAMPVGALFRGANAPVEVKRAIEERVAAKEVVTLKIVKDLIAQHRTDKRNDPVRLDKQRRQDQRREQRLEREQKKLQADYARMEADQATVAVEIITVLKQALDDQKIRFLLDRWRHTTLPAIQKALSMPTVTQSSKRQRSGP